MRTTGLAEEKRVADKEVDSEDAHPEYWPKDETSIKVATAEGESV